MAARLSRKEEKEKYRESNDQYFEAILQLRAFTEEQFNTVIDYIEAHDCRITKHVPQKEGIDLYLFSQKFIQHLARWLKDTYNIQITTTRTLHTRDSKANKDLYRVTVLAWFLKQKVGDIVMYNGEEVKIMSMGKKPSGKILATGKRIFLDAKQLS